MTTADPFTTPDEADREACAEQANDLLAYAAHDHHFYNPYLDDDLPAIIMERHAASVLYASQAATAHATLAVHANLDRIAAALEAMAKTPAAIQLLADHVSALEDTLGGGLAELVEAVHKHSLGVSDDQCEIVKAINGHADTVCDAVGNVAEVIDRVRWWQWRRRWFNRRQRAAAVAGEPPSPQEESPAEVHAFLVEVRQDCPPWALASNEVLGRVRFYAEPHAACDTADTMLPGLCAQLAAVVEPGRPIHGLVYRCDPDPDGPEDGYVGSVFLPGAAVVEPSPDGS
ncbi:hypothetical protein ACBJ59_10430 [Nonomuraea sp. MTCD27]|uniref:hypothetical protein n=1 Tax=Nonomuraea sp. MTCD27 TaxID=1676747 RepID=UPI0035C0CCFB